MPEEILYSTSQRRREGRTTLWRVEALAQIFGDQCTVSQPVSDIQIDSRKVIPGDLFVALRGPNTDGHHYIRDALNRGAVGVMVTAAGMSALGPHDRVLCDTPYILVEDALAGLRALATAARQRSDARCIAITGSYGKTSMKECLKNLLAGFGSVHATERSYNGEIGVPLTLARMPQDVAYGVFEMGMNEAGALRRHAGLVRPHVAVVTVTGSAHIGKLGSRKAIATEKSEIFSGLEPGGTAIVNAKDRYYSLLTARVPSSCTIKSFANATCGDLDQDQDTLTVYSKRSRLNDQGQEIALVTHACTTKRNFTIPSFSNHWASTLPACFAVLDALGMSMHDARFDAGLSIDVPVGRGNIMKLGHGITVIDESYNAGPESMINALVSLQKLPLKPGQRAIAVLGDMLELGDQSQEAHVSLLEYMDWGRLSRVYCIGEAISEISPMVPREHCGGAFHHAGDALISILADLRPGDIYLVKGSRGQWSERGHLSEIVEHIEQAASQKKTSRDFEISTLSAAEAAIYRDGQAKRKSAQDESPDALESIYAV